MSRSYTGIATTVRRLSQVASALREERGRAQSLSVSRGRISDRYSLDSSSRGLEIAGKKRVARLAFYDKSSFEAMVKVKVGVRDVTAASVYTGVFSNLGDWAFDARAACPVRSRRWRST